MTRFSLLIALIAITGGAPADASVVRALDLAALTARADTIVHGRVGGKLSYWDGGRIVTEQTVTIIGALKGSPGREVIVRRFGGVVHGIGQIVHGTARLRTGEEVVLFLRASPSGYGFRTVGMAQGKFAIGKDPRTGVLRAAQDLGGLALVKAAPTGALRATRSSRPTWKLHDLFSRIAAEVARPSPGRGAEAR